MSKHQQDELIGARARKLLGKQVRVTLGNAPVVTGRLLGFGEGGDFEVLEADGFIHYCWPMLDIEEARPGQDYGDGTACYVSALGVAVHGPGCPHEPGQRPS